MKTTRVGPTRVYSVVHDCVNGEKTSKRRPAKEDQQVRRRERHDDDNLYSS